MRVHRSMPKKYFISYSHRDPKSVGLAKDLTQGLKRARADVFVDTALKIGADWGAEIGDKINWCDYLVILISDSVRSSEMVQSEVRLAYQRYKKDGVPKLLPIRVAYSGPLGYELESYLGKLQYRSWDESDGHLGLLQEILDLAGRGEDWGELDSESSYSESSETCEIPAPPEPAVDLRMYAAPGGTQSSSDPFYLERQADKIVKARAQLRSDTLVIKALRQMGKSSLLARYLDGCAKTGKRLALIDLSILTDVEMQDYGRFLSELATLLLHAFEIEGPYPPAITRQAELIRFIEKVVLPAIPDGGVIAFDEVDRVLGRPYQGDFFSMLRVWHNNRAFDPKWDLLSLALVISTEPYLLIDAADRSPFNVTPPVELEGFRYQQCIELNGLYGNTLPEQDVRALFDLLDGHPYLTRLAFYHKVSLSHGLEWVLQHAADRDGPFADHLNSRLLQLSQQPYLLESMRKVVSHGETIDDDHFHRLKGAGLVRRNGTRTVPANRLYAEFFGKVL